MASARALRWRGVWLDLGWITHARKLLLHFEDQVYRGSTRGVEMSDQGKSSGRNSDIDTPLSVAAPQPSKGKRLTVKCGKNSATFFP